MSFVYYNRKGEQVSLVDWLVSFGKDRTVAYDTVMDHDAKTTTLVSTVFIGLHYLTGVTPKLFETYIRSPHGERYERHETEEAAVEFHNRIVASLICGEDVIHDKWSPLR